MIIQRSLRYAVLLLVAERLKLRSPQSSVLGSKGLHFDQAAVIGGRPRLKAWHEHKLPAFNANIISPLASRSPEGARDGATKFVLQITSPSGHQATIHVQLEEHEPAWRDRDLDYLILY